MGEIIFCFSSQSFWNAGCGTHASFVSALANLLVALRAEPNFAAQNTEPPRWSSVTAVFGFAVLSLSMGIEPVCRCMGY